MLRVVFVFVFVFVLVLVLGFAFELVGESRRASRERAVALTRCACVGGCVV
jgi:hypothetical protein